MGTHEVRVGFANEKPDVALAGVRALIDAYAELSTKEGGDDQLKYAKTRTDVLAARLKEANDSVLRQAVGKDLANMDALREQLEAQLIGKGRIQIADRGALPVSPSEDERPLMPPEPGARPRRRSRSGTSRSP